VRHLGSFLQVVRYRDRYLIRDGNHRAIAFLSRGIHAVPALVRESSTLEEIRLRRGMLPADVLLSERPPLLPDYLDDDVSAEVQLPATQRVLMVQAIDIPVLG
jgi:ParB-like chromosome segregation protein Spo0J